VERTRAQMPQDRNVLTLVLGRWYVWQMLPGYVDEGKYDPFVSPIYIESVEPQKTGNGSLKLAFLNAAYATGVQGFELTVRVLKRGPAYLIAELPDGDRAAIIAEIGFDWLRRFCAEWWAAEPADAMPEPYRSDVQAYLDVRQRRPRA
jgi:hypothetical protein